MTAPPRKLRIATASLAGCFGCHMSLLDLDERLLELLEKVDLDRTPLTDLKHVGPEVDIGLIEGGVCNAENVHVLREFRARCRILVAVGECAISGGVPALRNHFTLRECLETTYLDGVGVDNPQIPNDPEIPLLLSKVHPIHEVVKIDHYLPGCPPSADAFFHFLSRLAAGQDPTLPAALLRYD